MTSALHDEFRGEDRLARPGGTRQEDGIAGRDAPAQHVVQALDPDRHSLFWLTALGRRGGPRLLRAPDDDPREHLNAVVRDAERVEAGDRRLPTHLHHLHLANHRIALDALMEPEQAIRHREDRVVRDLRRLIFADEKRRRFPAREPHSQLLHEVLQVQLVARSLCRPRDGAKRIDDDDAGVRRLDFLNDAPQNLFQRSIDNVFAQIDEVDRLVDSRQVEKTELLLIPQHLDGGLADHGEVQRGTIACGQGEHQLLRERRLPRTGGPGDEIEGELGQTPTKDVVETLDARGKSADCHPVGHARVSSAPASEKASGHA